MGHDATQSSLLYAYLLVLNSCCRTFGCCMCRMDSRGWVALLLYVLLLQRSCAADSSCQKVLLHDGPQRLQGLQCSIGKETAQQGTHRPPQTTRNMSATVVKIS